MIVKINEKTKHERVIGETFPDMRIFRKTVQLSKHLFQKFDAWGIDAKFFTDVLLPKDYEIEVIDTEDHKIYKTTAEKFKKNGEYFHFKQEDEDHRSQIFLSRRHWSVLQIPRK